MKKIAALKKGFTLIELLVVIAIIAILAVLVFVALNPAVRFRDARNSRRTADVNNILTAVHSCIVDNEGAILPCTEIALVAGTRYELTDTGGPATGLCTASTACTGVTNCANLEAEMVAYLRDIPADPGGVSATGLTEYTIEMDVNNIVTISECAGNIEPAGSAAISASR